MKLTKRIIMRADYHRTGGNMPDPVAGPCAFNALSEKSQLENEYQPFI